MPKMNFIVTELLAMDLSLNLYQARISVELKHDNNSPLDGNVKIAAPAGEEIVIATDPGKGTGTGKLLFTSPAAATVLVAETRALGQLLTARQPVSLKSKAKLIPDRLSVSTAGSSGKYIFIVSVLDKDNAAMANIPVRIINEKTGVPVVTGNTDQHGSFTSQEVCFPEKECSFLVISGGIDPVLLKLEGPSKWKKAPRVPEPDPADINQGLWHTITSAWQRGASDTKRCAQ